MLPDRHRIAASGLAYMALALLLAGPSACARSQPRTQDVTARMRSPHGRTSAPCADCHDAAAWVPTREDSRFDHAKTTSFDLAGAHTRIDCRGCHFALRFDEPRLSPGGCGTCHVDVHAGRLGAGCTACHDTHSFTVTDRRAAHNGTGFPLTGMHRQIECSRCHTSDGDGRYGPLPTDCATCHASDYLGAVPDHGGAGFRTGCASCHGTLAWSPARFDHTRSAGYPLQGAHGRIECRSCHQPPDFSLRVPITSPGDCVGCHRDDYDRVHPGFGFSLDCLACHTQDSFRGARLVEHEARFPIASGPHARRWTSCSQCHEGPDIRNVTCLTCHEHSRTRMDDKHSGRPGYSYTTDACLTCHPRGRKE